MPRGGKAARQAVVRSPPAPGENETTARRWPPAPTAARIPALAVHNHNDLIHTPIPAEPSRAERLVQALGAARRARWPMPGTSSRGRVTSCLGPTPTTPPGGRQGKRSGRDGERGPANAKRKSDTRKSERLPYPGLAT